MSKRLTYDYVKEQIESVKGYKLLSKSYINNSTKLNIQCDKGHEYKVKWSNFQQKQRCPYCYGKKKLTYDYVKEQIESVKGYKLLSKNYKNAFSILKVRCNKGHIYKPIWSNFQKGQLCSYCAGKVKYTYEYVKKQIENVEGYKLLSTKYFNIKTKLKVQCNKGHEYKVIYSNFQKGKRCPKCCKYTMGNNLFYEYIKEQLKKEKYTLLSRTYKNNYSKLKIKCNKSHVYKTTWAYFQMGYRCPVCNIKKSSKAEKEVFKIVKQLTNESIISNDRTQITNPLTGRNLELDIWIPSLNKAIEYNGIYWHSNEYAKYKDNEKDKQCREKNIELLVINEQDWLDNKSEVIKQITNWI